MQRFISVFKTPFAMREVSRVESSLAASVVTRDGSSLRFQGLLAASVVTRDGSSLTEPATGGREAVFSAMAR